MAIISNKNSTCNSHKGIYLFHNLILVMKFQEKFLMSGYEVVIWNGSIASPASPEIIQNRTGMPMGSLSFFIQSVDHHHYPKYSNEYFDFWFLDLIPFSPPKLLIIFWFKSNIDRFYTWWHDTSWCRVYCHWRCTTRRGDAGVQGTHGVEGVAVGSNLEIIIFMRHEDFKKFYAEHLRYG